MRTLIVLIIFRLAERRSWKCVHVIEADFVGQRHRCIYIYLYIYVWSAPAWFDLELWFLCGSFQRYREFNWRQRRVHSFQCRTTSAAWHCACRCPWRREPVQTRFAVSTARRRPEVGDEFQRDDAGSAPSSSVDLCRRSVDATHVSERSLYTVIDWELRRQTVLRTFGSFVDAHRLVVNVALLTTDDMLTNDIIRTCL